VLSHYFDVLRHYCIFDIWLFRHYRLIFIWYYGVKPPFRCLSFRLMAADVSIIDNIFPSHFRRAEISVGRMCRAVVVKITLLSGSHFLRHSPSSLLVLFTVTLISFSFMISFSALFSLLIDTTLSFDCVRKHITTIISLYRFFISSFSFTPYFHLLQPYYREVFLSFDYFSMR